VNVGSERRRIGLYVDQGKRKGDIGQGSDMEIDAGLVLDGLKDVLVLEAIGPHSYGCLRIRQREMVAKLAILMRNSL
jgi:hypothetical protein